jgi:hypothetical protein
MVDVVINVATQEVPIRACVQLDINWTRQDEPVTKVSWCVSRKLLFNLQYVNIMCSVGSVTQKLAHDLMRICGTARANILV